MFHVEHFRDLLTLVGSIHDLPAHYRRHNLPRELPAIEWSVVRFRAGLCRFKGPAFLGIEHCYVGVTATRECAPASEVNHARRTCGEELDNSCQRNLVFAMQARDGEAKRRFESRDSEHGALALDDLFMRRMGGVICQI